MARYLYEALHRIKDGSRVLEEGDIAEWDENDAAAIPEALRGPLNVVDEDEDAGENDEISFDVDDVKRMRIGDLQDVAKKLGIPDGGLKKDLLARILSVLEAEDEDEADDNSTGQDGATSEDVGETGDGEDEDPEEDDDPDEAEDGDERELSEDEDENAGDDDEVTEEE